MTLLARLSMQRLKDAIQTLWARPTDSENPCVLLIHLLGTIKSFHDSAVCSFIFVFFFFGLTYHSTWQGILILKEPIDTDDDLFRYIYEIQQTNLRLIVDQIKGMSEANDVSFLFFSFFPLFLF